MAVLMVEVSLTKVTAALVATPPHSSHGEKGPASLRPYDASSMISQAWIWHGSGCCRGKGGEVLMWDTKIRELIDRLFIEANGDKSAFEESLREADIEFVSSESDIVAVPAKYEEENTVYNYFEDGGGVWCYVPPVKNTLQ